MSKNATITEGKQGRTFDGTERLETEQPDGNSCFWVLEDERQLDVKYVMENGDYYPDNYAMSEINVNVIDKITDLDGEDWEITIDDIGIPHIILPDLDIDITIDPEDGLPEINIDGLDIDLPDIDGLLDLDEDIDISLDGMDLDITGVDLDGLDLDVSINLDTLDIETYGLPNEIRIIKPPIKTEYKDGEEIDLDGIAVQAYRNGLVWGNDIPVHELIINPAKADKQHASQSGILCKRYGEFYYYFTQYTPGTAITINGNTYKFEVQGNFVDSAIVANHFIGDKDADDPDYVVNIGFYFRDRQIASLVKEYKMSSSGRWDLIGNYGPEVGLDDKFLTLTYFVPGNEFPQNKVYYTLQKYVGSSPIYTAIINGVDSNITDVFYPVWRTYNYLPMDATGYQKLKFDVEPTITYGDGINVSWPRPRDGKILTTAFSITMEEEADTDTHHSGTFGDDETGHSGDATTGEDGGSHYSGKF